ncbi:hypothetical protein CRUP_029325, partial [Coryphaenoides rupestris]
MTTMWASGWWRAALACRGGGGTWRAVDGRRRGSTCPGAAPPKVLITGGLGQLGVGLAKLL